MPSCAPIAAGQYGCYRCQTAIAVVPLQPTQQYCCMHVVLRAAQIMLLLPLAHKAIACIACLHVLHNNTVHAHCVEADGSLLFLSGTCNGSRRFGSKSCSGCIGDAPLKTCGGRGLAGTRVHMITWFMQCQLVPCKSLSLFILDQMASSELHTSMCCCREGPRACASSCCLSLYVMITWVDRWLLLGDSMAANEESSNQAVAMVCLVNLYFVFSFISPFRW